MKRFAIFGLMLLVGCAKPAEDTTSTKDVTVSVDTPSTIPSFSLAASEYPSWSTFMVASKAGLIDPKEGQLGTLEKKWQVDVVLQVKDYDPCLTLYANGSVDAVCITNMDVLNPALGRESTAICPTSTSVGADKVIGVGVNSVEDLKSVKVYGLKKSVSHYVWYRGLEKKGLNPAEFQFENLDPAPASTALQTGSGEVKAICVWNPYALQTLRNNTNSKTVFDSSLIPEEVIDMVVVANGSLSKPGGEAFAYCLCDAYYAVCSKLNDGNKKVADATLKALGEDFSSLPIEDMKICTTETRFYDTPEKGIALFHNPDFQITMNTVVTTCEKIEVLEKVRPTIGYGDGSKQLNFDPKYMQHVAK